MQHALESLSHFALTEAPASVILLVAVDTIPPGVSVLRVLHDSVRYHMRA
jgi:hypothetical protein